jgi:hypothetical protein
MDPGSQPEFPFPQLPNLPVQVTTTNGIVLRSSLWEARGQFENKHERTSWLEYYDGEDLVHRSVHVYLKHNVIADAFATEI